MKFETVEDASSVSNFEYLIGVRYVDDESLLEFETTRVTTHKGLTVGYRTPVLRDGKRGVEEKAPIHIANIVRMLGMSIFSTMTGPCQQDLIRGILKQDHSATKESAKAKMLSNERTGDSSKERRVRFALQELV